MRKIFMYLLVSILFIGCTNNHSQNSSSEGKIENTETKKQKCEKLLNEFREKMTPVVNEFIESLLNKDFDKAATFLTDDCGFQATPPVGDTPQEVLYSIFGKEKIINELKDENSLAFITMYGNDKRGYKLTTTDDYELNADCIGKEKTYKDFAEPLVFVFDKQYHRTFVIDGSIKKIDGISIVLPKSFFKGYESYFNKSY
jgi:hypothetical protein